jgi:hypothetical protein
MPEAKTKDRRVFIQMFVMAKDRIIKKMKIVVENAEESKSLCLPSHFSLSKSILVNSFKLVVENERIILTILAASHK